MCTGEGGAIIIPPRLPHIDSLKNAWDVVFYLGEAVPKDVRINLPAFNFT